MADHVEITEIAVKGSPQSALPVNARDVFWAIMNASQRDPSSPLAVEWTIILLKLLLNPSSEAPEVQLAAQAMRRRIALLRPTATLREQLKTIPGVKFPD